MQQSFSRTGFDRAAKDRQRAFRDESQTVSADAKHPEDERGLRNPHLLALGYEEENLYPGIRGMGGAVDFFAQRNIKWWKSSRSGDDTGVDGPTRNMASSQVACVNFLLPLAGIPGALSAALQALDDDVRAVVDIHSTGATTPRLSSSGWAFPAPLREGTPGALRTPADQRQLVLPVATTIFAGHMW